MKTNPSLESLIWESDTTFYDKIDPPAGFPERKADTRLFIPPSVLEVLSFEAFSRIAFLFPKRHLEEIEAILDDPKASRNDRATVTALLENATISSQGRFPSCQDTGSSQVIAWKGKDIQTDGNDENAISNGIEAAYRERYLRKSIVVPTSMTEESNSGTNLPAQIEIYAGSGREYLFYFTAKGGGSSNKTMFFQESKGLLTEKNLRSFLREKIAALGTSACPPYHLAVVVGGLSPEYNLKMLKLASMGALDSLKDFDDSGGPIRCPEWEVFAMEAARETGLGAQFGGIGFAVSARIIRLPRHAASLHVSVGVSCAAHRSIRGKITAEGVFLERLEKSPMIHGQSDSGHQTTGLHIDLDKPMPETLATLKRAKLGDQVFLSGPLLLARDAAHARFLDTLESGKALPDYLSRYPVYYAGPSETPPDAIIGSLGPTTANRMDVCAAKLMKKGASLITLAKGNRSEAFRKSCGENGGIYLGTTGGAAALLSSRYVVSQEILDYPELGMEAVRLVRVKDIPAYILVDATGTGFYETMCQD